MNSNLIFHGESLLSRISGFFTLTVIFLLGIGFISILNTASIITGSILVLFCIFITNRIIKSVTFKDKHFEVKYYFGRKREVSYDSIIIIYKNMEGFIGSYVYVVGFKFKENTKKITFYCLENEIDKVFNCLENAGVSKARLNKNVE